MSDNDPRDYRSLGDLLRDARAERKLNLEQVNEATKISTKVLQALEQDDLDAASGAVYARGFVRTLALYYDLDPEWLGAKLDQLAGETSRPVLPVVDEDGVIAAPVADPVASEEPEAAVPKWEVESTRVRKVGSSNGAKVPRNLIYGLVAILVVAIVVVVWIGRGNDRTDQGAQRTPAAVSELASNDEDPGPTTRVATDASSPADPPADPPTEEESRVAEDATEDADEGSAPADDPEPIQAAPTEVVVENTPASPIDRSPQPQLETADEEATRRAREPVTPVETPAPDPTEMVEAEETGEAETGGLPSVLRPSAAPPGTRMELRVIAEGPVEVTLSADGSRGEVRTLGVGEAWTIEGRDHFSLAVSDPTLVRLEIDGRPRTVPAGWSGEEWILYPPRAEGGNN